MLTVETEKILLEFLNPLLSSVPFYTPPGKLKKSCQRLHEGDIGKKSVKRSMVKFGFLATFS